MKNMFQNKYVLVTGALIIGITIGWLINSSSNQHITTSKDQHITTSTNQEVWTCSMHPSVRQSEPGKCPICGMDLIPLDNEDEGDPAEIKMSETAMKLANIQTTIVGTDQPQKSVRLNGKVQADERRRSSQAAHIPGRIEQLMVNFTGEYIQKGQTIALVYSPELVTAQQELFEAYKIKESQPELFSAAREKLKNWKLTDLQIDAMIASEKIQERFPLKADVSGVVLERRVSVGDYVMRGAPIYDVADLSQVWVLFDVYEADLPWVKKNDPIEFTVQSLPGESFKQKISFIDPVLNASTRVATARVEMNNPGLQLKPEMFATGTVKSNLKDGGKDLIVPKSAVLWTGERSIVYTKIASDEGVSFRLNEVTLGPSLGEAYVVRAGLNSGDEVVTNGTFTIDAAAQLAGKPSMMNPDGGKTSTNHQHGDGGDPINSDNHDQHMMGSSFEVSEKFKTQVAGLLLLYLELKDALVKTNADEAATAAASFVPALRKMDMKLVKGDAKAEWEKLAKILNETALSISNTKDVESQRKLFSDLSNNYYLAIQQFDVDGLGAYYQFCPMAFNNQGAYWISKEKQISNPYFGDKMMRCGVTKTELN